jgi:hypothetical protein
MALPWRILVLGWIALAWPGEGTALERTAREMPGDRELWSRGSTATIRYWNLCTGWAWSWSDFAPGERVGVSTTAFAPSCHLVATSTFSFTGVPSGYGYTGTVDVHAADAQGCPTGPVFASQPFLPADAWNTVLWGYVMPAQFVVSIVLPASAEGAALYNFASDRPAAGPTGPIACGTCYPMSRTTRSFLYGAGATPDCPGTPFFDGFCNAELLMESYMLCVFAVDTRSWGGIKALYR